MSDKLALTIGETAERLGVSESTVKRQIKAGRIPAVHYGRTVRVPARALAETLERLGLEERRARVAAERAAQGLPPTGEDPTALAVTAQILTRTYGPTAQG